MGTETRIGIATGLLIVIVASVYFFYGGERTGDDLLIATGPNVELPRIPAGSAADARSTKPMAETRRPDRQEKPLRPNVAVVKKSGSSKKRPSKGWRTTRPTPTGTSDRLAQANQPDQRRISPKLNHRPPATAQPTAKQRKPTALRTGPSQELLDATRDNLRNGAGQQPSSTSKTPRKAAIPGARNRSKPAPSTRIAANDPSTKQRPTDRRRRPAEVWPKRHKVDEGDTLSAIAAEYYESSRFVSAIVRANPKLKNPHRLKIGDILVIPAPRRQDKAAATKVAKKPAPQAAKQDRSSPPRSYVVREGDSFYSIARKMLGSGARWQELYARNRELVANDPRNLKPGLTIALRD